MANLVRNFIKGRMNKSVDERLVPDGEYIDAQNIRMGSTEDSEIGTVENTKGNTQLTTLVYPPTGTALSAQATCIGAYSDGANETMYWFVHDPAFTVGTVGKLDLIVSYNTRNDTLTYHVVSIKDATDATRTTLNFDPQNLITGVDLVDGLLFFTDDKNPPRRINVATAYPQPVTNLDYNVLGDDIRVIKAPPTEAPVVLGSHDNSQNDYMEDRIICFAYRYEYENGEYSATSQFSAPAFVSKPFNFTTASFLNEGMENAINTCDVTVRTGSSLVKGIDILFKEMDDSIIRVIERVDKATTALTDNADYTITFSKSKIFTILPDSEILRLYDNVPRLAKAQTLMGNRLVYGNYLEGYDLTDSNGQPIKFGYEVSHMQTPVGNSIASASPTNTQTYTLTGGNTTPTTVVTVEFDEFNLIKGDTFTVQFTVQGDTPNWTPSVATTPTSSMPATTVEVQYTLTETFASVVEMVASTSFLNTIGTASNIETTAADFGSSDQRIWTNAWNASLPQSATGGTPDPMALNGSGITALGQPASVFGSTATSFSVAFPMPEYEGGATDYYELLIVSGVSVSLSNLGPRPSLHSNRSYEVGIVYMDDYGRSSTALVNFGNDIQIPCSDSIFRNYIRVQIPSAMRVPAWADRYKFVIKPDEETYETIYSNIITSADSSGNRYFLLEGENAAKIETGDRLIVKADTAGPSSTCTYAEVLDKKAYPVDGVASGIPAVAGTYMKIRPEFNVSQSSSEFFIGEKSAGTNGGSDQNTDSTNDFPVLVYDGFATIGAIPAGSRIRLTLNFSRQGRGDAACETRTLDFDHTWTADAEYTNIINWFYNQDGVISTIENATGFSGDPNTAAPTNNVLAATTTAGSDYGITGSNLVNQMRWHTNNLTNPTTFEFIVFGTNKCSGGFGSGSSPNRRSRVKANWTVITASETCVFETEPSAALPDLWYESSESFQIDKQNGLYYGNVQNQTASQPAIIDTDFFNCISYGNGVESYKIRDSVKGKPLSLGNRVTTVSDQDYKEIRRFADLTYSGVYNDETNLNKLNEFNLGLLNFKPLEDSYGSVEKLFARKTDILTLQEDKISYVLAGKNLLSDAVGGGVISSVPQVLGTQVARTEDFGISNNPESFAEWGPHKFFTDAKRGAVIHLFGDGQNENLEVISEKGMRGWFRDEFISGFNTQKLGGYDPYMNEYVLASNDVLLPGETACIECNAIQTFLLTSAGESYCVELGNEVGNATVSYNVIEASGGDTAVITGTYNNVSTNSGSIGSGSTGSFTINKDSVSISKADIAIALTGSGRFVVQVIVECPLVTDLTMHLVTLSRPEYQKQSIHSQYEWASGNFTSPLSSTPVTFQFGGSAPVVSEWIEFTSAQGSNLVPTNGSDLTLIYNRLANDSYTLRAEDRFHLLRTATKYTQFQVPSILGDGALVTVVPSGAQPRYIGDFANFPTTGDNVYLIWDYSNASAGSGGGDSGGGDSGGGDSGGGGETGFLLDQTYATGAAAAYSTRRLYSLYTGAAMRIRRDTGAGNAGHDEEADVLFDANGDLNLSCSISNASSGVSATTFGEFVGATGYSDPDSVSSYTVLAYVDTWYDQSTAGGTGSGNDAEQSTPGSQPQIYNGSAVITENGKPTLKFNGAQKLDTNYAPQLGAGATADYYAASVATQSASNTGHIWRATGSAIIFGRFQNTGETRVLARDSNSTSLPITSSVVALNTQILQGALLNNGTVSNYINGSIDGTGSTTFTGNFNISGNIIIGSLNTSEYLTGNVQEFIFYATDQTSNRSGIETDINAHFRIYQPTTQPTSGLLYDYGSATGGTDAAAAYSVRQLSDKAVLCMTVRRDMGVGNPGHDDEITIGFDTNGDLDTQAISDFCGTGTGYVSRWWDQSVNGNDAEQSTPGSQPQIYNGSAVITENGKPALDFDGSSDTLKMSFGSNESQPNQILLVATNDTTNFSSYRVLFSGYNSSFARHQFETRIGAQAGELAMYAGASNASTTQIGTSQSLYNNLVDGASSDMRVNGASIAQGDAGSFAIDGLTLGARFNNIYHFDGRMQELVFYPSDKSSSNSGIETNIDNYFNIPGM